MPTITLTNRQVIELVNQLPSQDKRAALLDFAEAAAGQRPTRMAYADEEREAFVDDLLYEGK